MGFFRVLLGIWASWMVIGIARRFLHAQISKKADEPAIKPNKDTLELLACPYCGVFTTTPCTNSDCPGRPV
jgi:hypothetical protein